MRHLRPNRSVALFALASGLAAAALVKGDAGPPLGAGRFHVRPDQAGRQVHIPLLRERLAKSFDRHERFGREAADTVLGPDLAIEVDTAPAAAVARFDRERRALVLGLHAFSRASLPGGVAAPGTSTEAAFEALNISLLLMEFRTFEWPFFPAVLPELARAGLALKTGLGVETIEEAVAAAMAEGLYLRDRLVMGSLLADEPPQRDAAWEVQFLSRMTAFDGAMRRRLRQPEGRATWWLDPLPAPVTAEELAEIGLGQLEFDPGGFHPQLADAWLAVRRAASGAAAVRVHVERTRPDLPSVYRDWTALADRFESDAEAARARALSEGDRRERERLAAEAGSLSRRAAAARRSAGDAEGLRAARAFLRDLTEELERVLDDRPGVSDTLSRVGSRLHDAYREHFASQASNPLALAAAQRLSRHDVLVDAGPAPPERLAWFQSASGEIRIGLAPIRDRMGLTVREQGDEAYAESLALTWDDSPAALSRFVTETAPVIYHELVHAEYSARVRLPFEALEDEVAARLKTALYLRGILDEEPNHLELREFDGLVRKIVGEPVLGGSWWLEPLRVPPRDAAAAIDRIRAGFPGRFHPHVPALWLDLRTSAAGPEAMAALLGDDPGLEPLGQDWRAHVDALRREEERASRSRDEAGRAQAAFLAAHRRRDELVLRAPELLDRGRAFYRDELARLARELE